MGKMKEKFIDEINRNAQHITFDTVDEHSHIDDDYHYNKHKQDEEEEEFEILTQAH